MLLVAWAATVAVELVLTFGFIAAIAVFSKFAHSPFVMNFVTTLIASAALVFKFWIFFGVWEWEYLVGSVIISLGATAVAYIAASASNSIGRESYRRANTLLAVYGDMRQGWLNFLFAFAIVGLNLYIVWVVYSLSQTPNTEVVVAEAMRWYFSYGAVLSFMLSTLAPLKLIFDSTVGPVTRNVLAGATLISFGVFAWRVLYPFLIGDTTAGAIAIDNYVLVLAGVGAAFYIAFVVATTLVGGQRFRAEKLVTEQRTRRLLRDVNNLATVPEEAPIRKFKLDELIS
ncbi:MAG: hypothetical protein AAFQ35_08485, partial [Pseudomonadota bacterium]